MYKGVWNPSTTYSDGDIVKRNQVMYQLVCPLLENCVPGVPEEGQELTTLVRTSRSNSEQNSRSSGATGSTGATGAQGIQGIQGEKGDKGDTGEQGRSAYRNAYSSSVVYLEGDIVKWQSKMWVLRCIEGLDCDRSTPPNTDGNDWHMLSGDKGDQGSRNSR